MRTGHPLIIPETEAEFQKRVTDLAESFGWQWMHIGRVGKYVPNGAKGTLGKGWPDLVLTHPGEGVLFVELKVDGQFLSNDQQAVMQSLQAAHQRTDVWRPVDWPLILQVLSHASHSYG